MEVTRTFVDFYRRVLKKVNKSDVYGISTVLYEIAYWKDVYETDTLIISALNNFTVNFQFYASAGGK